MIKNIRSMLIRYAKKNVLFRKFLRIISNLVNKIIFLKYYLFYNVDDKLIIFESFGGRSYSDSPKSLYLELLNNSKYKDYKFVWFFQDVQNYKYLQGERTMIIKVNSYKYYKYYSKAKYWIVNSIVKESIIKKKNQIYVQCWHGTPLKKIRCDITVNGSAMNTVKEIRKRNDIDAKRFDYFISPSRYATEKFMSAFNLKKLDKADILIESGYPRNDYLSNYTENDIKRIKKQFNISSDKKIILYAPTFRDNEHDSKIGYTYKIKADFDNLKKELSSDYVILFRAHYFVVNSFDFDKYREFVYDVSKYDDINELYIISDILITDYSSVFFDYAILKRPIIFYMYDKDVYKNELRDFYISLDELPGIIVYKEDELVNKIKEVSLTKINRKYINFNKKYNYLDDGNVSKRVVEVIFDEKENKENI